VLALLLLASIFKQLGGFVARSSICTCRFLGTSGQNIDDLYKYSDAKDKLEFMERTLRWRHLAPTAPNSLGNPSSPAQFGMSTVKIVGL